MNGPRSLQLSGTKDRGFDPRVALQVSSMIYPCASTPLRSFIRGSSLSLKIDPGPSKLATGFLKLSNTHSALSALSAVESFRDSFSRPSGTP